MAQTSELHRIKVAPKGMGLNDFVALDQGLFADEGLDVQFDWKTFRGTQSRWKYLKDRSFDNLVYRPQEK